MIPFCYDYQTLQAVRFWLFYIYICSNWNNFDVSILIRVEKSLFYVFPLLEYIFMFIMGQNALTIIFAKM